MSEQAQKDVVFDALEDLYIDADDVNNIVDFFKEFKIDMPAALQASIDSFRTAHGASAPKEQLVDLQNKLRVALCATMVESESKLFKDELFDTVRQNSQEIVFRNTFDKQVAEELTVKG
jgi:hypothetical protein